MVINDINKPKPPTAPKPPKTPLFSETIWGEKWYNPIGESQKRLARNIGERAIAKIEKRRPRMKTAPSYKTRLGLEKPKPVSMASVKGKKSKAWYEEDFNF